MLAPNFLGMFFVLVPGRRSCVHDVVVPTIALAVSHEPAKQIHDVWASSSLSNMNSSKRSSGERPSSEQNKGKDSADQAIETIEGVGIRRGCLYTTAEYTCMLYSFSGSGSGLARSPPSSDDAKGAGGSGSVLLYILRYSEGHHIHPIAPPPPLC